MLEKTIFRICTTGHFSAEIIKKHQAKQTGQKPTTPCCSFSRIACLFAASFCVIDTFHIYLLCHLSYPVGSAVAEVWPFGAPGPCHSAEEGGDACKYHRINTTVGGRPKPCSDKVSPADPSFIQTLFSRNNHFQTIWKPGSFVQSTQTEKCRRGA